MGPIEEQYRAEREERLLYLQRGLARDLRLDLDTRLFFILSVLAVGVLLLGVSLGRSVVAVVVDSPNAVVNVKADPR